MNEILQPTTRRTVIQRSLAFAAGIVGMKLAAPDARGGPAAAAPSATATPPVPTPNNNTRTLTFYAKRLQIHNAGHKPGQPAPATGKLNSRSELLAQPGGEKVGEFFATCFTPESQFGFAGSDHAVELQTLKLSEGTLFGIGCAGPMADGERAHAILGGTGQFAGLKGSYLIRPTRTRSGSENVEFVITFVT